MSKAEVYLAEAYNRMRGAGAALALASLLLLAGFIVLMAGASTYKVYVNPADGSIVPNATRADVEAGRVVEDLRLNTTRFYASLATPMTEAARLLIAAQAGEGIYYFGYSQALLFFAAVVGLAASAALRGIAVMFRDYASVFRAASLGGLLKVVSMVVLLYALWQIRGAILEESEALFLGALGIYYLGGVLAVVGSVLYAVPLMLASGSINAHPILIGAAAIHVLGAITTFLTVNTLQLVAGPVLCMLAGALYALGAQKTLGVLG